MKPRSTRFEATKRSNMDGKSSLGSEPGLTDGLGGVMTRMRMRKRMRKRKRKRKRIERSV
jgi:hypothetical protein